MVAQYHCQLIDFSVEQKCTFMNQPKSSLLGSWRSQHEDTTQDNSNFGHRPWAGGSQLKLGLKVQGLLSWFIIAVNKFSHG